MLDDERPVEGWKSGEIGDARENPELDRVEEERRRHHEVEERLDDEGRGERRVRGVPHSPLGEVELDDVSGPGWRDRIDAYAGDVGAEDAAVRHALGGIRGPQDVLPSANAQGELDDVKEHSQQERDPADGCQGAEERLGRIEKRANIVHASDHSSVVCGPLFAM